MGCIAFKPGFSSGLGTRIDACKSFLVPSLSSVGMVVVGGGGGGKGRKSDVQRGLGLQMWLTKRSLLT